jgi:two-component system, cell cycle response regulator CpdR
MGRRVLVVDDDSLVLEVTVSMLEELGCDVLQAHSGNDALEKIADDPSIEILITDINKRNGIGTTRSQLSRPTPCHPVIMTREWQPRISVDPQANPEI